MRVLLLGEQFWPSLGGAEIFASRLMDALRERGFEFAVVTRRDSTDLPTIEKRRGVTIHRIPFWNAAANRDPAALLSANKTLATLKRDFAPDLIHLNGFAPTSAFFHLLTHRSNPLPCLITLHALLDAGRTETDTLLESTLDKSDQIVACSEAIMRRALELVPGIEGRLTVIRHGLPEPRVEPLPLPTNPPVFLCLGRLTEVKGFDTAVEAFARVVKQHPAAKLVIAGDGDNRYALERQVARLGLERLVEFRGWAKPSAVPPLINSTTALLIPSRNEGFGLVALEGGVMARPVIASKVGGLVEVVKDNETGILCEPDETQQFVDAMERILWHPDLAEAMGHAARKRVLAEFDWNKNVDGYEQMYRRLVKQSHSA